MSWADCHRKDASIIEGSLLETRDQLPLQPRKKILLFSYAFPPMQVQMAPAVYKPMAAISRLGFDVDVVCADSFVTYIPRDESLLPYIEKNFNKVIRLRPSRSIFTLFPEKLRIVFRVPDLMAVLHRTACEQLLDMELDQYEAVMTWSPFHSINPVMVQVKRQGRRIPWIAQFSDPWAGNPLEIKTLNKLWNWWHEPEAVKTADVLVHSSAYSLDLMLRHNPQRERATTDVIPHAYDTELYPERPKARNKKITLRYVGGLYGRRSPEPLFLALASLFERRRELRGDLAIEFVGAVQSEMLQSAAAKALPPRMVTATANVSYVESLEKMYDADILLLIDADIRCNLFLPSKLSDYLGANTPIVGIVPAGASEDELKKLGCWHARPTDISGIATAIENAVDHVLASKGSGWCNQSVHHEHSSDFVARRFAGMLTCLRN